MLFFAFLSLVAMRCPPVGVGETVRGGPGCPSRPGGWTSCSRATWLCRTHRGDSLFVDLDHVAPWVSAAGEALEASRPPGNDRVSVGAGLDDVPLSELLVEERVQTILASSERVDLSHGREYRKRTPPPLQA